MIDRYDEWRDFYAKRVSSWMSLEELRAECGKLPTADATSPELLLVHAMHALEECVQRNEALEQWRQAVRAMEAAIAAAQRPADDEVVFIDGVGAGRRSVESCRDGVQWIRVGDRVYWPLSDSDAKRLLSACCGNGHFDGPSTHVGEGEQQ